ncbi:MAG TPA: PilZ domain-containing protein [Candidatus Angelobacter sp.]
MSRRREPRVEVSFEVKAWGLDRHGKPFVQHARTLDITKLGAKLIGIDCVNVGEIIGIQNGEQKARFKVVWIGRENTPKAGQIGVHCLEPEKAIFTQPKKASDDTEREFFPRPAIESSFERVKPTRPGRRDAAASRRKHPRYPCTGGVELRQNESGPPAWGNISDISLTGCYVETMSTLPVGSMVHFHLRTHNLEIQGRAVVKTSHHAVGMGIAFLYLSAENQQTLEFLIGMLAGIQEMRPEEKRTFVPADSPVQTDDQAEVKAPALEAGPVSGQIANVIQELTKLQESLVRENVDPRLIAQFHEAMAHTRQTAWTVQQWLDLRSGGNDPFAVMPQLEAERINMLIKLSHNILADIDASGMSEFSHGIDDLWNVVQLLHKRLAKMFMDLPEETRSHHGDAEPRRLHGERK